MTLKEERERFKFQSLRFKEWASDEIVRRLDRVKSTGNIESFSSVLNKARIVIKVPYKYQDCAREWDMFKSPTDDTRVMRVSVYSMEINVFHDDPDGWTNKENVK